MFLRDITPSPILFNLGPVQIHWYGFLIVSAIVINFFIARYLFKKYNLKPDLLYDLGFYTIIFGIIGARIWHVLSEIGYYIEYPIDIFKVWNGGLAIHGGIIAGLLVILFFKNKITNWKIILDIFAPLIALGQSIGRWGNYFNQELFGLPLDVWWAIPIKYSNRPIDFKQFEFFHPAFLYESIWCFALFIFLVYLHQKHKLTPGYIFYIYLILYSVERFFIEFIRIDPMAVFLNLRLAQWTSLIMVFGIIYIFFAERRKE